jgi:hypothetical protein
MTTPLALTLTCSVSWKLSVEPSELVSRTLKVTVCVPLCRFSVQLSLVTEITQATEVLLMAAAERHQPPTAPNDLAMQL